MKNFKGLHKESLRDNMANIELDLNMLAEASTSIPSTSTKPSATARSTTAPPISPLTDLGYNGGHFYSMGVDISHNFRIFAYHTIKLV